MNYGLRISCRVEEILNQTPRGQSWSQLEENMAYKEAMETAMNEHAGEAWADGNIRIGDYILLVDSDTRVPKDCLLEAVSEMEQSPEVAILQFSSGVMNVTNNFFEKGITFFTNMIYTMIRFAVAGGDVAPFVGHNAILRWSAVQKIAHHCKDEDGRMYDKFWSEETVSEDFDMRLGRQSVGYIIRLASYKGDGFKEGVSITVYDELARWEKYVFFLPSPLYPFSHFRMRVWLTSWHFLGTHMAATSSSSILLSNGSPGVLLPSSSEHSSCKSTYMSTACLLLPISSRCPTNP